MPQRVFFAPLWAGNRLFAHCTGLRSIFSSSHCQVVRSRDQRLISPHLSQALRPRSRRPSSPPMHPFPAVLVLFFTRNLFFSLKLIRSSTFRNKKHTNFLLILLFQILAPGMFPPLLSCSKMFSIFLPLKNPQIRTISTSGKYPIGRICNVFQFTCAR